MSQQISLFDPYLWLKSQNIGVTITPKGAIDLRIDWRTSEHVAVEARRVVQEWAWLIKLQLADGGASIHKLYARRKVRLKGGKVVEVPHA